MYKFTPLLRKNLLNQFSTWQFLLGIKKYPIIMYVNLHNINNNQLHQLKNHMCSIEGVAQVINANHLNYLFQHNIKFKFLTTGNMVALMFNQWTQLWNFVNQYNHVIISTISVQGAFLNLCAYANSMTYLRGLFNSHSDLMIKTTMHLSCLSNDIYSCLNQPLIQVVNDLSLLWYQVAHMIENLSNSFRS